MLIPIEGHVLDGILTLPQGTHSIVLFVHGSGSSRLSPRNQFVAHVLNEAGIGTLLFDLLTPAEETLDRAMGEYRFNIPFLTKRLIAATDWVMNNSSTKGLAIGYFGASTGAAAALIGATHFPDTVKAVVSRGGRPDLADVHLEKVQTPTLLIVGGKDHAVIDMNAEAYEKLPCEKRMVIIPGATHLFEEPGTLEAVSQDARTWFERYL